MLPRMGLAAQCALLALASVSLVLVVAPIGHAIEGKQAWPAAAGAALFCLLGAELALLSTRLRSPRSPQSALFGLLLAMGFRLAIPLAGSLYIRLASPKMLSAGALYFMILFYLPILAIEILLELGQSSTGPLSQDRN